MEMIIRADENSVIDEPETGGGESNVSMSTGLLKKGSSGEEAEAECQEASATNYPGNSSLVTANLEGEYCDTDEINEEDTKSPGPDNVGEEDIIKPSAGKGRKLLFNCSNTDKPTLVDAPAEESFPENEELDEEEVRNYKVAQGTGMKSNDDIKFDESEGGSLKNIEIAAASADDVLENCTRKRPWNSEDFGNKPRKAFNHAGDSWEDNTKAVAKSAFKSASWEEQEPSSTEKLAPSGDMKKLNDDMNWSSFDLSISPGAATNNISTEDSDPWAQVEIKEEGIHMGGAVDVQVQLMEGSRGGWPQRRPPRIERPKIEPENQEVDNIVQSMRNILFNLNNQDNAKLSEEDETKVRALLEYHPQYTEKMGCGIDHIKINRHSKFKDVRCFWVVRMDGTETDFSYHKCLKEKIAKEIPEFIDQYDAIYRRSRT